MNVKTQTITQVNVNKARQVKAIFDQFYSSNTIDFDRKLHAYKINGDLFKGVTTITDVRSKAFLAPWAAKEAYTYLKNNWDIGKIYSAEEKEELILAAKLAWTKKSNKAKDSGTIAHEWISQYILGQKPALPDNEEALKAIEAFRRWEALKEPIWVASEKIIASLKHKVAGTLDSLAILNGKLTLVDFKTSGTVSESFLLQLFGYEILLEEMGILVEDRVILRIPKDGKDAEELEVNSGEAFRKFCQETFLHCLEIHKFDVFIKNNLTVNGKINLKGVN